MYFKVMRENNKIAKRILGEVFSICDHIGKERFINFKVVPSLPEGDTEDLLFFLFLRDIAGVYFHDVIVSLALCF